MCSRICKNLTLDFLDASTDATEGNAGVLGEDEVGATKVAESDPEQSLDVVGDDLGFRLGKHAEDDDGAASLEAGNLLAGACASSESAHLSRCLGSQEDETHCTPATTCG